MNSVVRQLLEQKTDVVMVDTGDSYEGICGYYKGTYISYSKEKPISMNPFKVTKEEYDLNFGEKKNFLKSLIFLIFKGNDFPSKIEDMLINQTIVEYYEAYFHPFTKFTEKEREGLRQKLLVASKMEEDYDKFSHSMEDIDAQIREAEMDKQAESRALMLPAEARRLKLLRQCRSLYALAQDEAASKGEKERALQIIENYKKELYNNSMLIKIDKQIDHIEEQKRRLKVRELSFNSYYEFALERIPQIVAQEKIQFYIRDFAAILKQFYRGGELEMTLNSDLDVNLFDEQFIVFEIDKIKDDPVLFPIVVLIIMDVFLQKMRIKKGADYRGSMEGDCFAHHGRIHQIFVQNGQKVPWDCRCRYPGAERCNRFAHREGSHHQQLRREDTARPDQVQGPLRGHCRYPGTDPHPAAADIYHQCPEQPGRTQLLQGSLDMPGTELGCVRCGRSTGMLLGLYH